MWNYIGSRPPNPTDDKQNDDYLTPGIRMPGREE